MSKKTNTLLFMLGATAFNVLITIITFVVLLVVYGRVVVPLIPNPDPENPNPVIGWGLPLIFIGSIVLSFFLYRFILKKVTKRIDVDKHFDPLFTRRRQRKN
ncbi:MAG: leader peptide processing enzyme [Treponema sp.]|nr:leader peptide processing enzyme [Treponema sp.]